MRRLRPQNSLNSSEEFDRVFQERRSRPHEAMDVLRWEALIKFYKGGPLLDVGCLDSLIPLMAKKRFPQSEIYGLDQTEEAIKELAEIEPSVHYIHGDAYHLPFPNHSFMYVTAGELIEHLDRPEDFIAEAFRVLKSDGVLAITTPKEETEDGEVDGHRHLWSFDRHDMKELLGFYAKRTKIGEIPHWLMRRIKYHHPYLLAYAWKR